MARWSIEPAGVRGVLTRSATHAEGFAHGVDGLMTHAGAAAAASGSSLVARALSDYAGARKNDLFKAGERIHSGFTGTVSAVNAYIAGDLAMAANAQQAASRAPADLPAPGAGQSRSGPR